VTLGAKGLVKESAALTSVPEIWLQRVSRRINSTHTAV